MCLGELLDVKDDWDILFLNLGEVLFTYLLLIEVRYFLLSLPEGDLTNIGDLGVSYPMLLLAENFSLFLNSPYESYSAPSSVIIYFFYSEGDLV
jgi:hypothetical protein